MKFTKDEIRQGMTLYAVTDRSWLGERTLAQVVEEVLKGGATFLQLREKELDQATILAEAREIQAIAARYHVPFVINDSVDIALACDADGVHVGQADLMGRDVRALIGPDKILGITANTVELAVAAERAGADYIGAGAVFGTTTKQNAKNLSLDTLKAICQAVSIPVVAIGGINADSLPQLTGTGAAGAAVVSALFAQKDPEKAARRLRALADKMVAACG
ncbi:thiamine-phosphate diphosphorylase [Flavonifractor sp. An112]|uniref:thiamine phosphate synthase n=1 Tax=Flavonifractor sp. An112 TaxID=1965544 RepID=UPI000B3777BD|nr:thiamine phosphate synthase [Flavonifractor sp. An112]OUQ60863.1 thiamine-phosphate diphosphorylase [Flavonifractor sp. An112]